MALSSAGRAAAEAIKMEKVVTLTQLVIEQNSNNKKVLFHQTGQGRDDEWNKDKSWRMNIQHSIQCH